MEVQEVKITKKQLETFASGSLIGTLMGAKVDFSRPIKILFEQTSLAWRIKHGGPELMALYEYTVMCIAIDIVKLSQMGAKVEIDEWINDPVESKHG
jgi:hypothetical protein